jgi:pyruvate dehydrogenase complex dehydrogenase (E1) component
MNNKMIENDVGEHKLPAYDIARELVDTLNTIQKRVLWLAMNMIHHANAIRPNPDITKVGGHQVPSASIAGAGFEELRRTGIY